MKSIWKSRTIWVSTITLVTGVMAYLQGQDLIIQHPAIVAGLGAGLGLLNIILRLITSKAVK